MATTFWILALGVIVGSATALDCVQIPDSAIVPLRYTTIPAGANGTVEIPPNWSCTYNVKVPPMVYAHVRFENGLQGNNDLITVRDAQLTRTVVSSRSSRVLNFYVFPNTTTTFQVVTKSVNMHSSFRLVVFYQPMLNTSVTYLDSKSSLRYFMLNDLQVNSYKTPQTVKATEKISLSIAKSGWDADIFDNYFVIEGDLQNNNAVYRLSRFLYGNYISTGNTLTIVGLDNRVSESSVIFSLLSQAQEYDSLTGFSTYFQANQLEIDATVGEKKKKAVNVISMADDVIVLSVQKSSNPNCSLKAVEAPPSSSSEVFLDFSTVTDFPRNITHKSFTIVAENCAATFKLVSPFP